MKLGNNKLEELGTHVFVKWENCFNGTVFLLVL